MQHYEQASLKQYNTFGLDVLAKSLWIVEDQNELLELKSKGVFERKHLILGGGSNVLLTKDFDGDVILLKTKGKEILPFSEPNSVKVSFAGGEVWHQCVLWAIEMGYGGIENLSLIPGTVGAAPMQNIGAYGVEIKDTFNRLIAFNKSKGVFENFDSKSCQFGYRESVFKKSLKDKYIITSVEFILSTAKHNINTSYGAIQNVLDDLGIKNPTIRDISNAVIAIRQSKLPDPKVIGNSGSFFKNPIVDDLFAFELKKMNPNMPIYSLGNGMSKLAAGWLIEQCGWKGKRVGETGAHINQALVLVNYGNAKGEEIWSLAMQIQNSVKEKFKVDIVPEVNVI